MLAMDVNDNACFLAKRVASAPSRANSPLQSSYPPLAKISSIDVTGADFFGYGGFVVSPSEESGEITAFFPPDLSICDECKKELFDAVWGKDCADTLKVVGNTVSNLRKKLAFCGLDGCLCTVGGGYAFRYVLAEQGKAHSNTVPTMVYCCPKELRENDPNLVHLSGEYLP